MTIDYRDVKERWDRQDRVRPPHVEYRVLSQSAAWQQLEEAMEKELTCMKSGYECELESFMNRKVYNADKVITQKALLDIYQAEIRIMETVLANIKSYRAKEARDAE